ncbi:MAG: M15 family metallopeptidase [Bacteroidia bacterium]|nr:M15 family metallopeptidase [Bacteroidia bacterium]NNK69041.1 M15 family metallopeptidase [Flavobacteriaceae bacterium]
MRPLSIIWALIVLIGVGSAFGQIPKGFVYIEDEIPSIKSELRYFGSDNFVGLPIDGYEKNKVILSKEATVALRAVQAELAGYDLSIKIFDAYRPQRAVNHFIRWARVLNDTVNKSRFYPDVDKRNLFKEEYIASRSGHSRGSTLDITLVDLNTCEELDMGSAYDFFGKESWVDHKDISAEQRANRMLLQTVMVKHGFRNYPKEWWHFTLRNEPYPETYFDFVIR